MNLRDFGMGRISERDCVMSPKQWLKSVTQWNSFTPMNASLDIFFVISLARGSEILTLGSIRKQHLILSSTSWKKDFVGWLVWGLLVFCL